MVKGQPFRFDVWFSYYTQQPFFNHVDMGSIEKIGEPIWSSSIDDYDLTYDIESRN